MILSGSIKERSALRHTPAGLPAVDLVIEHRSVVQEEGMPRKVAMDCRAVCIGTVAARAQRLGADEAVVFHGFLAASRNGRGHVLHVTAIRSPDEDG